MDTFSILRPATEEYLELAGKRRGFSEERIGNFDHPQEDYLCTSQEPPVFVVADGVTLDVERLAENNQAYPDPSPAGKVAQIFCEAVIDAARKQQTHFTNEDIQKLFEAGNGAVRSYNQKHGKSIIAGNRTDYFAATGGWVFIQGGKAYWGTICDSFVAHFDNQMNKKFMSTGGCDPYTVINGERRMKKHLETGVRDLAEGDRIMVYTDGFEHHLQNKQFQQLFLEWSNDLKKKVIELSQTLNEKDPDEYGHERSLIVIKV